MRLPSSLYGLGQGRAVTAPLDEAVKILQPLTLGVDPVAIALLLSPVIVGFGMEAILGENALAWFSAAVLYAVNPFVQERLGSAAFGLILSMDVLPFVVAFSYRAGAGRLDAWVKLALVIAAGTALSPQFLPLGAITAVVVLAARFWIEPRPVGPASTVRGLTIAASTLAVASAYWLIPTLTSGFPGYQRIGPRDLVAFASLGDPRLGLFGNLMGLYGFWRPVAVSGKSLLAGWWVLLTAILIVISFGFWAAKRSRPSLAWPVAILGAIGLLVAAGSQGPTGTLFKLAYLHVPGFRMFREPEKALMLFVLSCAVFFALGTQYLCHQLAGTRSRRAIAAVLISIPLVYGWGQLFGDWGAITPARYPASWYSINRTLHADPGAMLVLPWHQFEALPFTHGRVVANPASAFFGSPVLVNDDDEIPALGSDGTDPRDSWVKELLAEGPNTRNAGHWLVPLGVKWILLEKTADWGGYTWLLNQSDVKLVAEYPDTYLLENTDWLGAAYATLPNGENVPVGGTLSSPISVRIDRSVIGSASITVTLPFARGWHLAGGSPRQNAAGTMTFNPVLSGLKPGVSVTFSPWRWDRYGTAASLAIWLVVAASCATSASWWRRRKAKDRAV
jgi:hypothetical protein